MEVKDSSLLPRGPLIASSGEVAAVLFASLAYFIYISAFAAVHRSSILPPESGNLALLKVLKALAVLTCFLLLLLAYLRFRGWKMDDLAFNPSWKATREAVSVTIVALLLNGTVLRLLHLFFAPIGGRPQIPVPLHAHNMAISAPLFLVSIIVNALFEQIIFMSYAFRQIASKLGLVSAVIGTALLRSSIHTWQLPDNLCATFANFLFYGIWFCYRRSIWTLVLTEIAFDSIVYRRIF